MEDKSISAQLWIIKKVEEHVSIRESLCIKTSFTRAVRSNDTTARNDILAVT